MGHGDYTHIEIPADDPARARRFYEVVFGWSFTEMPGFPDYYLYATRSGEGAVGGAIGRRGVNAPAGIRNYVDVDSLDASIPVVERLGGRVVQPKAEVPGQGWYAVVADSEGNEIALWESLARP